jgi:signal transduction histidine kinase
VTNPGSTGTTDTAGRSWDIGLRARLLLAFVVIAGFAVLAAAAGIYAFREVGGRLEIVDARIAPTLSALELSRSAERIIAAAPALLAATDRNRRDEIKAALVAEAEQLNATLADLKRHDSDLAPLLSIEPIVAGLTANIAALEDLVERRLESSERIRVLRQSVFRTNDETRRLLAPWLEVLVGEITAIIEARKTAGGDTEDRTEQLASLIEAQRLIRAAQAQVFSVAEMLTEASTADEPQRLEVLAFQLGLALRDLETVAPLLVSPELRWALLQQIAEMRAFTEGPNEIAAFRNRELELVAEGEKLLAEIGRLSADLTAAVDQLGSAAKRDIGDAIGGALSLQRLSTRILVAVVALSLLTSVLIVWLYVGGNIVRRLTSLSDGMLAIAGGKLTAPVTVDGADEITAMGQAVEVFRRNTLERDRLLAERAEAAGLLESEVRQRTAELAQSVAEVEEKSRQLEFANQYKTRFLASASHDLRQPLHALNLLVAQLRADSRVEERTRLVARINAALGSMNELLEALLDMSKLDAGVLETDLSEFPVQPLLARMETTFAEAARDKGLRFRVVPSSAWVRSDFILLERIVMNLVSNAVRYTGNGGILLGSRRRGGRLRIDICDTGPGIHPEQQRHIFGEFVQLSDPGAKNRGGLGLGLSIVDRLSDLLDHPIEMNSQPGSGSRFSIAVPAVAARAEANEVPAQLAAIADPVRGKLVVVIDDDVLALEGMTGILRSWGCNVIAVESTDAALAKLAAQQLRPDLIISDYRLANGDETGIDAIRLLRNALGGAIPALLISGDTTTELLSAARASGLHLLHKPVAPMRLRAMCNQLLKTEEKPVAIGSVTQLRTIRRPQAG